MRHGDNWRIFSRVESWVESGNCTLKTGRIKALVQGHKARYLDRLKVMRFAVFIRKVHTSTCRVHCEAEGFLMDL